MRPLYISEGFNTMKSYRKLTQDNFDLTILVEGPTDQIIVKAILKAANLYSKRVVILSLGSKKAVKQQISSLPADLKQHFVALVDSDIENIPDSRSFAKEDLGNPPIPVFCVVPEIEAWLFADDELALRLAYNNSARYKIKRLPVPEKISYPKQVAKEVFKEISAVCSAMENMNVERAMARSASLRDFLTGISDILHAPLPEVKNAVSHTLSRDIFASLIREIVPSASIVWKTSKGDQLTAQELLRQIEEGTELGRQYISDVLRIARDMLSRKAKVSKG